jgi:MFS family permease
VSEDQGEPDSPWDNDADRARLEAALRRRGLPLVVRRDRRGSAILRRATPALTFLLINDPLTSVLTKLLATSEGELERRLTNSAWVFGLLAVTVAALVVPIVAGWLVSKWLRAVGRPAGMVLAGIVLVLLAFVLPVVEWAVGLRSPLWLGLTINIGLTGLVLVGVYAGAGSILAWGLRRAFSQLGTVGTMATKALPLLVLVVLFAFFSTEMWQIANALDRWRLWLVVALFAALSVLFMIAVLREELRGMVDEASSGQLPGLPAKLADLAVEGGSHTSVRLTRGERANLMLVLFLAQALQIALLAVLVFCLFAGLGALAVDDSVVDDWLGAGAFLEPGTLFGVELPLPKALVQLSIFLSVFSGLYFTASAATDPLYRQAFFDPLIADVRVSLAVRQVYLARRADEP